MVATVTSVGVRRFGVFIVLSQLFPHIWCQIGRGYQQNHPNHVLGSQLKYDSASTTVQTPQTGKDKEFMRCSHFLREIMVPS